MVLEGLAPTGEGVLASRMMPAPVPCDDELLIHVEICGVCRTDLDLVDGRIVAPSYPVVPGHQIIGRVLERGKSAHGFPIGERVGVAWIHSACGVCQWCRTGMENLCPKFSSTGCDANGGYAELMTVRASYAYQIPGNLTDIEAAPLLCAGAIGWRSLRLAGIQDGDALGLTGFGASAHLVLQLARYKYPKSPVYVFARNADERGFAQSLGASWVGDTGDTPPTPARAIIDTTPAWKPVVAALRALAPGGRLVINAIRKSRRDQAELGNLDYATDVWMEREIKSVANVTRADVRECLAAASASGIRPRVEELPLEDANVALAALRNGDAVHGARVLRVSEASSGNS
ncbi:MAG: zinc-binding alcohol dehydrogenase family protein [Gemmatimonadaceae bacterium]